MSELGYSPLWRAGFYGCQVVQRMWVGTNDTLRRRQFEIDKILTESGLTLNDQGMAKYSEESQHGYTYETCLTQSSAAIHTYPERTFASANFETCGPLEEIVRTAVDALAAYYGAEQIEFLEAPRLVFPTKPGEIPRIRVMAAGTDNVIFLPGRRTA